MRCSVGGMGTRTLAMMGYTQLDALGYRAAPAGWEARR